MEPLYRTSSTLTWKEYRKFHKTDTAFMRGVFFILLFYQLYALFSRTLNTIQFVLILCSVPLTLVIYFLFPLFLLKKEYDSTKILQDMKLDYCFYPGFFTVSSCIGMELYYYNDIKESIETNTNLYLRLRTDQYFFFEKSNCSPELLKFLLNPTPKEADEQLVLSLKEESSPELPAPLFTTYTMFATSDLIKKVLKLSSLQKTNRATGIPTLLLTVTLGLIYMISIVFQIAKNLQQNNLAGLIGIAVLFALYYLTCTKKDSGVPLQADSSGVLLNIKFYDTYIHCTLPGKTSVTYLYHTFYQIKEEAELYRIYLTRENFIPIAKANCSPELITFLQELVKDQTQNKK